MPDRQSIRQQLTQFLEEDTNAPHSDLGDAVNLRADLGLDSVDFVGIIMRIEGHYRVRLTHAELETVVTVGNLLDLLEAKIAETANAPAAPPAPPAAA